MSEDSQPIGTLSSPRNWNSYRPLRTRRIPEPLQREAAEWIVAQVFDGGGKVVGCYDVAVLVFQVNLIIVFHAFPKIIDSLVR